MSNERRVTKLIAKAIEGDSAALRALLAATHKDLRHAAQNIMRSERQNHTLQATALVNEVCTYLLGHKPPRWTSPKHYFLSMCQAMRNVLKAHARAKNAQKRTPPGERKSLDEVVAMDGDPHSVLLSDDLLECLSKNDARAAQVFELRVFAGLTIAEVAKVLGLGIGVVIQEWAYSKAWLMREWVGYGESGRASA